MRIVALSDTHGFHEDVTVPDGDVLVHAGDWSRSGSIQETAAFVDWLDTLPHEHKLVVAGNHDMVFEQAPTLAQSMLAGHCTYLQDTAVTIEGVKFWGAPWQPAFMNWAFNLPRGDALAAKWALIPRDVDVLITHGPPYGILDACPDSVGCRELARRVDVLEPRVHIFGHIHESYGTQRLGATIYHNVASCDRHYDAVNPPVIIDL